MISRMTRGRKNISFSAAGRAVRGLCVFGALALMLGTADLGQAAGKHATRPALQPLAQLYGGLLAQVRWPDGKRDATRRLCLFGQDDTTTALRDAETASGFEILPIAERVDLIRCDAVYLADSRDNDTSGAVSPGAEGANFDRQVLLKHLARQPILTLGPGRDFLDRGGMIGILGAGRAIFINQGAAWGAGLRFSKGLYLKAANFAPNEA